MFFGLMTNTDQLNPQQREGVRMYENRKQLKSNPVKARFNDFDNAIFEFLARYRGKQKATIVAEYALKAIKSMGKDGSKSA